jgi:HEAT repeats
MSRIFASAMLAILVAHAAAAQSVRPPRPPRTPAVPRVPATPVTPAVPQLPALPHFDLPVPPDPPDVFVDFDPDVFSSINDALAGIDFAGIQAATDDALASLGSVFPQRPFAQPSLQQPFPQPPLPPNPPNFKGLSQESAYEQARALIERDQYDRALQALDRVIEQRGTRTDAAMYWKAYSLSKLSRASEALSVLGDLQKQFAASPWVKDARALEVEVRQQSGQAVSADAADDEVKLLALRGLMQSDPDAGVPIIEKMLAGNASVRVKDRALFVLSQSRSTRAREVIAGVARNASNPDLRMRAIRYLGMRSDTESRQVLDEVYRASTDMEMKRAILRSFMVSGGRDRLLALAKSEKSPELRAEAVQQLGPLHAGAELDELYRSETDRTVKERILQSMHVANASDRLAQIARTEKDPELQRTAIRMLGLIRQADATDALRAIYTADAPIETRKAVIESLMIQQNAAALVALARAEKNPELKTEIVRRLSTMRSPEARDYMLELLK